MLKEFVALIILLSVALESTSVLAADGDYRGSDGYGQNGYSFILNKGGKVDEINETIELLISFDETYTAAKGPRPNRPGNKNTQGGHGCFAYPYGDTKVISCKSGAVPSIFSGVVYTRRPHKKAEEYFVCTKNCSKRIPRILVWQTEEGS